MCRVLFADSLLLVGDVWWERTQHVCIYMYLYIQTQKRQKMWIFHCFGPEPKGKTSCLPLSYPVPAGSSEHCCCPGLYLIHCSCQTSTCVHHTAALHITTDAYLSSTVNICRGKPTERGCKVLIINEHNTNGESNLLFACDIETYILQTHATHHKRTGYLGDRSRETLASASNNQRK